MSLPPPPLPATLPSLEEEVSLPPAPPAAPPMSPFLSSPPPLPSLPIASPPVVPPPLVEAPPPVPPVFEAPAASPLSPPVVAPPVISMDPPPLPSHPAAGPQKPQRHGSGANLRSALETSKSAAISDPFASEPLATQDPFGASGFGANPAALKAWDAPSAVAPLASVSFSSADPFAPSGNGAEDDVFGSSAAGQFSVSSTHPASAFSNDAFATDSFSDAFAATSISSAAAVSDPFAAPPISNSVPNTIQAPTSFPEVVAPVVAAPQLPSFVQPQIPTAVPSLPLEDDSPIGLPKLAPQLDDDPFDLHIDRPLPVVAPAPVPVPAAVASAPAVVVPKAVSKPAIDKESEGGDPFAVLVGPLKPVVAVAAATTSIDSGVPLKTLLETKPAVGVVTPQVATSTVVPPGGPTQTPSNPFALNAPAAPAFPPAANVTQPVVNLVSAPAAPTGQIGNSDPFGLPSVSTLPADPFGMDSLNADPFGLGSVAPVPSKATPVGEPFLEETQAAEDTFGPCDDPFAAGFTPSAPVKKQPVAATADLLGGDDMDIFSSVPAPAAAVKSAPTAAARVPPPLPARASRPNAAPKTGAINTAAFVAAKQSSAVPSGDLLDGFDFASGPTKATTNPAASTPSNPFAPTTTTSTPSTAAGTDLFGDDPFASHGEAGDHHEESTEDVMRRLRRAYSLHSDQSEEVEEEDEDVKPISKVLRGIALFLPSSHFDILSESL